MSGCARIPNEAVDYQPELSSLSLLPRKTPRIEAQAITLMGRQSNFLISFDEMVPREGIIHNHRHGEPLFVLSMVA